MRSGDTFEFTMRLYVGEGNLLAGYEEIATTLYGFQDYRRNAFVSLNTTLENVIHYGTSDFDRFLPEVKGYSYATDIPGAVKNVSALHPLSLALVTDNASIYAERGRPILEYMLSRTHNTFKPEANQRLEGPVARLSELVALDLMTGGASPVFRELIEEKYQPKRLLNQEAATTGYPWERALAMYRLTQDRSYLDQATAGAEHISVAGCLLRTAVTRTRIRRGVLSGRQ